MEFFPLESLEKDTVIWDSRVVEIDKEGNGYRLKFRSGPTAFADFVIIANGGMSNIRSPVTDAVPEYTGSFVIQGEVINPDADCPNFKDLSGGGNFVVFGEQKILSAQTKRNGAIVFYVSFRETENWAKDHQIDLNDKTAVTAFLLDFFKNWDDRYKELFRSSEEFTPLAMKRMPLEKQWDAHAHITLIGDAAHLMPPFAGQGVNIGLLDTLYLTDNLTNGKFSDLQSAILDYEQKMFDYASQAQKITSPFEITSHSENALQEIEELKNKLFQ